MFINLPTFLYFIFANPYSELGYSLCTIFAYQKKNSITT